MTWQATRAGSRPAPQPSPPERIQAWFRDVTASAFAIARWEDDGGLVAVPVRSGTPPSTDGRMVPRRHRYI
jgi:hypothetical protein